MGPHLQSALGLLILTLLAHALGERGQERRLSSQLRVAATGVALQLALALLLLKLPLSADLFHWLARGVAALQAASEAGTGFVFGYLGGAPLPFEETRIGSSFVLAFRALPLVLLISALSSLLFYWRILPAVVRAFSWALRRSLGVGGAVGVGAAANIFVGMVEAPLLVRPYFKALSRSELFMIMTCGMATIAGTVMVLYASFLADVVPDAAGHLLIASIISAPAAITVARLMIPETAEPTAAEPDLGEGPTSAMDAITRGALDGMNLLIGIVALLVVLVGLVHLVNLFLGLFPDLGDGPLSLQRLAGWLFAPLAWLMGLPWSEALVGGRLLGVKTILNELLAYAELAALPEGTLSERSRVIMTYGLCGFANFGSLGIMIGGLGALAPERRGEIAGLGLRAIVAGTLATCMTGAVVGLL